MALFLNSNPFSSISNLMATDIRDVYPIVVNLAKSVSMLVISAVKKAFTWIKNRINPQIKYDKSQNIGLISNINTPIESTVNETFQIINMHLTQTYRQKIAKIGQNGKYYDISMLRQISSSMQFSKWCGASPSKEVTISILLEGGETRLMKIRTNANLLIIHIQSGE